VGDHVGIPSVVLFAVLGMLEITPQDSNFYRARNFRRGPSNAIVAQIVLLGASGARHRLPLIVPIKTNLKGIFRRDSSVY
jgi:hypothetical protein